MYKSIFGLVGYSNQRMQSEMRYTLLLHFSNLFVYNLIGSFPPECLVLDIIINQLNCTLPFGWQLINLNAVLYHL